MEAGGDLVIYMTSIRQQHGAAHGPAGTRTGPFSALATEHFVLQAVRSTIVNEQIGRDSIYMGAVSRCAGGVPMASEDFPAPSEGFVLTHFIVAADVARSRDFYTGVLGGKVVLDGEPTIIKLANSWVIINVGGGPTDDKPEVVLEPPTDPTRASAFLNLRVADIQATYQEWRSRGAEFLTPPKVHSREIRCYMRDPDGHLIEVGQTTGVPT
jgi:catechol 2,3-dioxygenase-like lactoylglutathione lyase family enzyme